MIFRCILPTPKEDSQCFCEYRMSPAQLLAIKPTAIAISGSGNLASVLPFYSLLSEVTDHSNR